MLQDVADGKVFRGEALKFASYALSRTVPLVGATAKTCRGFATRRESRTQLMP